MPTYIIPMPYPCHEEPLTKAFISRYDVDDLLPVRWILGSPNSPSGCFFAMRTIVLIDGQNLFYLAKAAWGPGNPYDWPSLRCR